MMYFWFPSTTAAPVPALILQEQVQTVQSSIYKQIPDTFTKKEGGKGILSFT